MFAQQYQIQHVLISPNKQEFAISKMLILALFFKMEPALHIQDQLMNKQFI
jgi:hypothetical protein